jgi:hypothetical protein
MNVMMAGQSGKRASPCCLGPLQDQPFVGFEQTDDSGLPRFISSEETHHQQHLFDELWDDLQSRRRRADSFGETGDRHFTGFDDFGEFDDFGSTYPPYSAGLEQTGDE